MQILMKIRKEAIEDAVTVLLENVTLEQQRQQSELRALVEALLGVLVAFGSGYLILASLGSTQLVFCLFCLLIFAIAIRSSRRVSYSNSFIAALGYTFLIWQHASMDMLLLVQATFLMQPFLLIVVGILASDLLHSQRVRLYTAEMQIRQNKEKLLQLSQRFEKVVESKKELQQQIIEQEAPIASVCHQITQLWQLNNEERYNAIVDLVVQATGANSSALYLEKGNQFFLQTSRSTLNIAYPARLNKDDLLIEKVLQNSQVCTIREVLHAGQEAPAEVPMMAGPLCKGKHLLGVVIVGTMPLTKFTLSTTQLFSALLQLVSISLQEPEPPPASNTIDLQEVLNDEKAQQLKEVLNEEKTQRVKKVSVEEKMQILQDVPEDEPTQLIATVKRKPIYTNK